MSWIKVPNALPVHNWANGGCSKLLLLLPCCLPNLFFQEFHEAGQFICQHCSQAYYLHQVHHGPPQPPQPPQTQPSSESFSQSTSSIAPLAWELPSTHLNSFTPNTTNQTRMQAANRHLPNPSQLPLPTQGIASNPMISLPTVSLHRAGGSSRRGANNPSHPTATGFQTVRYLIFINPEPVSGFYFYFYCLSLK